MSLQITSPYIKVQDSNGNPYVGASLYVYNAGTTTPAAIYSDAGLSVALANPLTSDAAGNFPRAYIAVGTYKLRAQTAAGVLIWTEDNIDTGLSAGTGALPISRGGTGATTAAAARANLDVPANSELTALSTQITTLQSQIQGVVSQPQGYLTLTSLTPFITGDISAATAVYYTPDAGGLCPIWNGSLFVPTTFTELTLTLNSNHLAGNHYDCFVTLNSGSPIIVTGPAWNSAVAGSGARGAGAGTTELVRVNGLLVNKYAMPSARNGASTYSVLAQQATYVGSIYIDGTNGQISAHRTAGQSRKFGVWNAYNKRKIVLKVTDSTASWAYNTATVRQSNAAAGNKATPFMGLQDGPVRAFFAQSLSLTGSASGTTPTIGIGVDSTTSFSGKRAAASVGGISFNGEYAAVYENASGLLGISNYNTLEGGGTNGTTTFNGTETSMLMEVEYWG